MGHGRGRAASPAESESSRLTQWVAVAVAVRCQPGDGDGLHGRQVDVLIDGVRLGASNGNRSSNPVSRSTARGWRRSPAPDGRSRSTKRCFAAGYRRRDHGGARHDRGTGHAGHRRCRVPRCARVAASLPLGLASPSGVHARLVVVFDAAVACGRCGPRTVFGATSRPLLRVVLRAAVAYGRCGPRSVFGTAYRPPRWCVGHYGPTTISSATIGLRCRSAGGPMGPRPERESPT